MKKSISVLSMILFSTIFTADLEAVQLSTDEQKYSYSIGRNYGESLRRGGIKIDLIALTEGIEEALSEKKCRLTQDETIEVTARVIARHEETLLAEYSQRPQKNAIFLAKNSKDRNVITTKTGLQYEIIQPGTGASPEKNSIVKVHYSGRLIDGTEFDSSYKRGEPAEIQLDGVIRGWTEGLQLMKVGGKTRFTIPSDLAYGENGPHPIGPNAVLIFEIELLDIVKK
ncbi:MAG: FKBP-type peptidyl-prolyl cis-trans isomerase [Candidatus Rifleibacteriota bacterium]